MPLRVAHPVRILQASNVGDCQGYWALDHPCLKVCCHSLQHDNGMISIGAISHVRWTYIHEVVPAISKDTLADKAVFLESQLRAEQEVPPPAQIMHHLNG